MRTRQETRRNRIKLCVQYAIAALLLVGVLSAAQLEATWRTLSAVDAFWFAGALVAMTISRWLGALLTSGLAQLHAIRLTATRLFEISCISTLYGLVLPGSLSGGIVRWYRIGKPQRNYTAAAALILFERLIGTAVLVLLGVIGLLIDVRTSVSSTLTWPLALAAVVLLLTAVGSVSPLADNASAWLDARRTSGMLDKLRTALVRTLEAASLHRDGSVAITTIAWSVAVHLTAAGGLYLMALGLDLNLGFTTMLWLRALIFIATAAPLTPAGLGVRELSTMLLLGTIGVDANRAVALSLLQFAAILFFAALGGLFESRDYFLRQRSRSVTDTGVDG